MKIYLLTIAFCSLLTVGTAQNLQADLTEMLGWFTGEFDNFQQIYKEKEDKMPDSLRHEHIHSIFKPVKIAALGNHVFFVKQYMDGDTDKIYRMRIYNFVADEKEKAIRLDIFSFKDKADETQYKNAHLDPSVLAALTAENLTSTEGCGVFWQKTNDVFMGYMKPKACFFNFKRSGKKVYITDSLRLTPNQIWIRDEAEDADGNYVFGHKGKIHHKLLRCRTFKGWLAVRKDGSDDKYDGMQNILLQDQGQRVQFKLPDGTATKYSFELSQVIYGAATPVLKLAVYEEGNPKAIAYTWANPDARRIGINIRTVQAGFTLVE